MDSVNDLQPGMTAEASEKERDVIMTAVRVFDPAMCCSTGVCGPSVDPQLARFSATQLGIAPRREVQLPPPIHSIVYYQPRHRR